LEVCGEIYSTAALPLAVPTEGETAWVPELVEALKVEKNLLPLLRVELPFLGCSAQPAAQSLRQLKLLKEVMIYCTSQDERFVPLSH
jgi:hypothetical protein